jgi:DNA-binding NtrC family response regulator
MNVTQKILVVDDDPVVGKSIGRVLSNKGYAVITAANGEEAMSKLANEHYDLVFTDIKMPGISGLEVAERVKASQPWLPVVIITGYGSGAYEDRAAAAGVADFLHKPLSPEMIEASTDKALSQFRTAIPLPALAEEVVVAQPEAVAKESLVKSFPELMAGSFFVVAFTVALPFIGMGMLAWLSYKAVMKR